MERRFPWLSRFAGRTEIKGLGQRMWTLRSLLTVQVARILMKAWTEYQKLCVVL